MRARESERREMGADRAQGGRVNLNGEKWVQIAPKEGA